MKELPLPTGPACHSRAGSGRPCNDAVVTEFSINRLVNWLRAGAEGGYARSYPTCLFSGKYTSGYIFSRSWSLKAGHCLTYWICEHRQTNNDISKYDTSNNGTSNNDCITQYHLTIKATPNNQEIKKCMFILNKNQMPFNGDKDRRRSATRTTIRKAKANDTEKRPHQMTTKSQICACKS